MRIRLTFEDPLPAYKCWYEVPASCSTIHDLQRAVRKGFNLDQYCKTTRLDLDGFFLLPASTIAGSLKDGDLLQVMIRRKGDSLPPRHLPVSGGKKRSSEDAGLSNTSDRKASKKMKSTPPDKKPTTPPAKQDNAKKQQSGQGQQKQQPNGQSNKKKNQQNTKKAKESNSNNIKPQKNNEQLPSKANVQGKANKNNKGSAVSNMITNNNTKTNTSSQNSKGAETNGTKGSKNNRAVNERRKVHFSPESTSPQKKKAMSDSSSSDSSSDSSSSDGSHSSKDSSDSSNSDSDSSDDSDSDSSSSASDSNKKDERKATTTQIVPGKGKGATKSRNARRKLLKMKLAEAREEADLGSDSSGTNTLKRQTVAVRGLVETTPATLPLRTSGKTAKTTSQVNGKDPSQDNKKTSSPQANGKALAQAPTPPKVIMTSVDLKDSGLMTKTTPKRVTRSSQKKPNGMAHQVPEIPQPEIGVKQKDSGSKKTVAAENESDDSSVVDVTPRDYHSLPKSEDNLAIGDVIAFKTLEMGPSYQPIISDFKEATVLSSSITDMTAEVQLARQFRTPVQLDDDGKPILGKFDIYDEEEFERTRRGIVCLDILGLADCRIISKK